MLKTEIDRIAYVTQDAYSVGRYNSWNACAKALAKEGLNSEEVEWVLRSKWTRWAADSADKPYGKATSKDLMRFFAGMGGHSKLIEEMK